MAKQKDLNQEVIELSMRCETLAIENVRLQQNIAEAVGLDGNEWLDNGVVEKVEEMFQELQARVKKLEAAQVKLVEVALRSELEASAAFTTINQALEFLQGECDTEDFNTGFSHLEAFVAGVHDDAEFLHLSEEELQERRDEILAVALKQEQAS